VGWLTPVTRAAPIRLPCSKAAKNDGINDQLKFGSFIYEYLKLDFMQL
jgi:hypothetical protein